MKGWTSLGTLLAIAFAAYSLAEPTDVVAQPPTGIVAEPEYRAVPAYGAPVYGQPVWGGTQLSPAPLDSPQGTAIEEGWIIEVAPLWLQRTQLEKVSTGQFLSPGGLFSAQQTTRDLSFSLESGLQLSTSFGIGSESRFQALVSYVDAWGEGDHVAAPSGMIGYSSYFATTNPAFGGVGDAFDISSQSRYYNLELNVLRRTGRENTHWIAGFRYAHVGDDLLLAADDRNAGLSTGAIEYTSAEGRNHMFGFQAGIDYPMHFDYLTISLFGKVGGFGNAVNGKIHNSGVGGFFPSNSQSDWNFGIASMLDFGVKAKLRISRWLSLHGSYQVIGFRGIALAPEQLVNVNAGGGAAPLAGQPVLLFDSVHSDASIWMHGFTATFELNW